MSDRRQSFRDYLLEGAMIFVAVSLGFMTDSLRKHLVDRDTERAYMQAIMEDLQIDSLRPAENVTRLTADVANADTMVMEFMVGRTSGRDPGTLFVYTNSLLVNLAEAMFRPELEAEIALGTRIRELIRQGDP